MMNGVIPFAEFSCNPDDRRHSLMRSLMGSSTPSDLEIGITVEPNLLELSNEMGSVVFCMEVTTTV